MTMRFLSRRQIAVPMLIAVPLLLGIWAWRAASWRPKVARIANGMIVALSWTSDGQALRCVGTDGHYSILSGSNLNVLTTLGGGKHWESAQFSGDGRALLNGANSAVEKWSVEPPRRLWRRSYDSGENNQTTEIKSLALSWHGDEWAISKREGKRGSVWLMDREQGNHAAKNDGELVYPGPADSIALSPDGSLLAYGGEAAGIVVWSRTLHKLLWDGNALAKTPVRATAASLCFSPDGRWLACSFYSGELAVFDARTGAISWKHEQAVVEGSLLAFSADSQLLAFDEGQDNVGVRKVNSGELVRDIFVSSFSLAFSPDGSHLAVGNPAGDVQLWRLQ